MKTPTIRQIEGACYTGIATLAPISTALIGNQPLSWRFCLAVAVLSMSAGLVALKAFLSQPNPPPLQSKLEEKTSL